MLLYVLDIMIVVAAVVCRCPVCAVEVVDVGYTSLICAGLPGAWRVSSGHDSPSFGASDFDFIRSMCTVITKVV